MKRALSHVRVWVPGDRLGDIGLIADAVARIRTRTAWAIASLDWQSPCRVTDDSPKTAAGKIDWGAMFGTCPNPNCYKHLAGQFPDIHSHIVSRAVKDATDKYRQERIGILLGKTSIPSWRRPTQIPLRDGLVTLRSVGKGGFEATCKVASKTKQFEPLVLSVSAGRMPEWMVAVLDGYASGLRKLPAVVLHRRPGKKQTRKWYLQIPYDIEQVAHDRVSGRTLFVRRVEDEMSFLRCWIEFDKGPPWFEDLEWESGLRAVEGVERRRKSIQAKYRCDAGPSSRKGHGSKRANEAYERLRINRERRQRAFNYHRALYIFNTAIRWKCERIEIEDLTQVEPDRLVLGQWPYHELYGRLKDLCKPNGIECVPDKPIEANVKEMTNGKQNKKTAGRRSTRTGKGGIARDHHDGDGRVGKARPQAGRTTKR